MASPGVTNPPPRSRNRASAFVLWVLPRKTKRPTSSSLAYSASRYAARLSRLVNLVMSRRGVASRIYGFDRLPIVGVAPLRSIAAWILQNDRRRNAFLEYFYIEFDCFVFHGFMPSVFYLFVTHPGTSGLQLREDFERKQ